MRRGSLLSTLAGLRAGAGRVRGAAARRTPGIVGGKTRVGFLARYSKVER
jgi:hypothetical protein